LIDQAARRYLRFLALAGAAAALLAVVGYLPTRNLAGAPGVTAMLVACALCWLASAVAGLPVALGERDGRPPVAMVLGASLVRFVAVLGLTLAVVLSGLVERTPLLVWTALGYLVLLVVDTLYASAALGSRVPLLGGGAASGAHREVRDEAATAVSETQQSNEEQRREETAQRP